MAKNEQQTSLEESLKQVPQPEKAAASSSLPSGEYEDGDPVTVIWKSWGTTGMPFDRVTYFDRHQFIGGVGRRIPYRDARAWKRQGHGIHILPVDATEEDFIRVTGHKPLDDDKLASVLRATPVDKIAALLSPEALDKIAAMHRK